MRERLGSKEWKCGREWREGASMETRENKKRGGKDDGRRGKGRKEKRGGGCTWRVRRQEGGKEERREV